MVLSPKKPTKPGEMGAAYSMLRQILVRSNKDVKNFLHHLGLKTYTRESQASEDHERNQ